MTVSFRREGCRLTLLRLKMEPGEDLIAAVLDVPFMQDQLVARLQGLA